MGGAQRGDGFVGVGAHELCPTQAGEGGWLPWLEGEAAAEVLPRAPGGDQPIGVGLVRERPVEPRFAHEALHLGVVRGDRVGLLEQRPRVVAPFCHPHPCKRREAARVLGGGLERETQPAFGQVAPIEGQRQLAESVPLLALAQGRRPDARVHAELAVAQAQVGELALADVAHELGLDRLEVGGERGLPGRVRVAIPVQERDVPHHLRVALREADTIAQLEVVGRRPGLGVEAAEGAVGPFVGVLGRHEAAQAHRAAVEEPAGAGRGDLAHVHLVALGADGAQELGQPLVVPGRVVRALAVADHEVHVLVQGDGRGLLLLVPVDHQEVAVGPRHHEARDAVAWAEVAVRPGVAEDVRDQGDPRLQVHRDAAYLEDGTEQLEPAGDLDGPRLVRAADEVEVGRLDAQPSRALDRGRAPRHAERESGEDQG